MSEMLSEEGKMDGKSLRLEICSDSEEDWNTHLRHCAEGFQDSASFNATHPDPNKRRKFLIEYYKYCFETELSNGRAGLACVKLKENGNEKIVYSMTLIYNKDRATKGDPTGMLRTGAEAAEAQIRSDRWYEDSIHEKMRSISKIIDFDRVFGDCHVVQQKYKGMGLTKKYGHAAIEMLVKDGIARGKLRSNKPVILYSIIDDVRLIKDQIRYGSMEVAHLHETITHEEQNAICVNDHNAKDRRPHDFNCIIVYCYHVLGSPPVISKIKQMFSSASKL